MSPLDQTGIQIEEWTIKRMCHLADQPACRTDRQTRVCIECDYTADSSWQCGCIAVNWHKGSVSCAAKQAVQLVQLPTLAFPTDPFSFTGIPETSSMKQEKTLTAIRLGMASI